MKPAILALLALILGPMLAAADPGWNCSDPIPFNHVVIQAQRGTGFLAEESTLALFETGWSLDRYAAKQGKKR